MHVFTDHDSPSHADITVVDESRARQCLSFRHREQRPPINIENKLCWKARGNTYAFKMRQKHGVNNITPEFKQEIS
ncbi:hypothetical protein HMPREF9056_00252 [Actinomyces sp. oral taxon 170 str. F0386]|nr:hypothetical protein HMPREF9056_00252 [Actinomyces sp. oral taxon 170 str. F0386]